MDEVIDYFIKEPEREFHVRQLAKLTKKSPTTISKYLTKLKKQSLLVSSKKYRHLLYKANSEGFEFKDLKRYYNVQKLRKSGLLDFLLDEFNNPEVIVLFGSYGKGEDSMKSDIDILIVTPIRKAVKLEKFEKVLEHTIQVFTHSRTEIEQMKASNKELLNSMVDGIILAGHWELFR